MDIHAIQSPSLLSHHTVYTALHISIGASCITFIVRISYCSFPDSPHPTSAPWTPIHPLLRSALARLVSTVFMRCFALGCLMIFPGLNSREHGSNNR